MLSYDATFVCYSGYGNCVRLSPIYLPNRDGVVTLQTILRRDSTTVHCGNGCWKAVIMTE